MKRNDFAIYSFPFLQEIDKKVLKFLQDQGPTKNPRNFFTRAHCHQFEIAREIHEKSATPIITLCWKINTSPVTRDVLNAN